MHHVRRLAVVACAILAAGASCGDQQRAAAVPDAETVADAGRDGAIADSASDVAPAPDAASEDAGADADDGGASCTPLEGLGELACVCNELDETEWTSSAPFLFENHFDFGTTGWDPAQLTSGGAKILADGNLGGGSLESEIAAYEVLARCELATLLKTEGEIVYQDAGGKKTDLLVEIDARKVGVSITRAYHYPPTTPFTAAEAETLLTNKLGDIPLSAANATPADAWQRSILSVLAYDQQYADMVESAWSQLDPALRGDVILFVTVTDGDDAALY